MRVSIDCKDFRKCQENGIKGGKSIREGTGMNISLYFLPEWKGKVLKILSFREGFLGRKRLKITVSSFQKS